MRSNYIRSQDVAEVELEMESCINNSYLELVPEAELELVKTALCIKDD